MTESVERRRKLEVMIGLHREWEAAAAARVSVLVKAQVANEARTLTVAQIAQVFGIAESTWHRWVNQLGLRELAEECVAEVDRAMRAAGADETTTVADVKANPDLELAAGKTGVWPRP